MAKGIVLESGGRRYVLCAVDWCVLRNKSYAMFCEKLAAGVDTDVAHVADQHKAPLHDASAQLLLNKVPNPVKWRDLEFLEEVTGHLAVAVKESL